jgi:hypothetical protein
MNLSEPSQKANYSDVPANHAEINERLENWAKWLRSGNRGGNVLAMFQQYRSKVRQWEMPVWSVAIEPLDAVVVEKGVAALPSKHRDAIRWAYFRPYIPENKMRQHLGLDRAGLLEMLNNARNMLKNTIPTKKQQKELA